MPLLTNEELAIAQRVNAVYKRRLGWVLDNAPKDWAGAEFAHFIARYQRAERNLGVDGILGPKTWAHMCHRPFAPTTRNQLMVNGVAHPVDFPVVSFEEPEGLSFYGQSGWRPRPDPSGKQVNLMVLHWDECVSSHQCFHMLLYRRLSAHLLLDGDGTIYQTLDLATATALHARQVNDRSIGIEVQNPVFAQRQDWESPPRALIEETVPHTLTTGLHLDFYDVQKQRLAALVKAIGDIFNIPTQPPRDEAGQVLSGLCPPNFQGVAGHYHFATDKVDPGLSLWSLWPPADAAPALTLAS